jgi:hypothetical protein
MNLGYTLRLNGMGHSIYDKLHCLLSVITYLYCTVIMFISPFCNDHQGRRWGRCTYWANPAMPGVRIRFMPVKRNITSEGVKKEASCH